MRSVRRKLLDHGTWFVGSHPMAGSEKSGMDHARSDLYEDVIVFVTPTPDDEPDAIELLTQFWRELGALPYELDADRHDLACAFSSHMPHMVSAAMVRSVLGQGDSEANRLACAGGFRDMSRIAASNVGMWADICRHNRDAMLQAIAAFRAELDSIEAALRDENGAATAAFLEAAKEQRDEWFASCGQARGYRE